MRIANPISKKEAEGSGFTPWRAGDYDFEVFDASEEISSIGNEMIKLTLYVFDEDGNKRTVFDYLVNSEKAQFKIRHFAAAIGRISDYENGDMDINNMVNKTGRLKLRIKPAQGEYPAGNSVGDYIPRDDLPAGVGGAASRPSTVSRTGTVVRSASTSAVLDDDIPFAAEFR